MSVAPAISSCFAVLHVADFPLQAILRSEPTLATQAIVLASQEEPAVACCTRAAHAAGVHPGQSLPQAAARCPHVIVRTPRPDLEREAEAMLLAAAFSVSSQVERTSPGTCTIDLGTLGETRRAPALLHALAQLTANGFEAAAGIGRTPLIAFYAATQAAAGEMLTGTAALLAPLPLTVAEPSTTQSAILLQWGIKTLGQLTTLTKADVTHRLGRAGLDLWERASGGLPRPLRIHVLPQEFFSELDCEDELETLEPLLFLFRRFVERLTLDLHNAHFAAQALKLTLKLNDESRHEHLIRLPEPVSDAEILFRALHTYLETVRTEAAIAGVRLDVVPERTQVRQRGLFDGGLRDPHGFADTLARVMALVGSDRVGAPVSANTHRPDTFTLISPPATLDPVPSGFRHPPLGPALRRQRPPCLATVEMEKRRPTYLWTSAVRGTVIAIAGPWYLSGHWWEKAQNWQREEWDLTLDNGGTYRVLRTQAGWFLEGEYD